MSAVEVTQKALGAALAAITVKSLLARTQIVNKCRVWTGSTDRDGYGIKTVLGRRFRAHRLAYAAHHHVAIPKGLMVRHKCDVPGCINPKHLVLGTDADNMRDKKERGRAPKGEAHVSAKLSAAAVGMIRTLYLAGHREFGGAALGRRFGVTGQQVGRIVGTRQRAAG